MKVYAVTAGEYSDYRIVCICSQKERAQELADKITWAGKVEEYEVDGGKFNQGLFRYLVEMDWNGDHAEADQQDPYDDDTEPWHYTFDHRGSPAWENSPIWKQYGLRVDTWAQDETHAIKIANEIRTRLIAEGKKP